MILLVDGYESERKELFCSLISSGYNKYSIDESKNGLEAIAKSVVLRNERKKINCIICDY